SKNLKKQMEDRYDIVVLFERTISHHKSPKQPKGAVQMQRNPSITTMQQLVTHNSSIDVSLNLPADDSSSTSPHSATSSSHLSVSSQESTPPSPSFTPNVGLSPRSGLYKPVVVVSPEEIAKRLKDLSLDGDLEKVDC